MKTSSAPPIAAAADGAANRRAQLLRTATWTAVATVCAAGVGYGLQHSLAGLSWSGAAIGASIAVLLAPVLLWQRPPRAPRPAANGPAAAPVNLGAARAARAARGEAAKPVRPADAEAGQTASAGLPAGDAQRAVRDTLTGAYTQQHFVAATDREWSRIRRHGEDAALLMVDIDRFKALNDRWGNPCGDALLVEATRQVATSLRQYDLLARFGGGVLVVYLPHTDPLGALDVAERIRERVSGMRVAWQGESVRCTVSVGVAAIGASHGSLDEAIADAGAALRDAKAAGRNCVRAAPIPPRRGGDQQLPLGDRRRAGPV